MRELLTQILQDAKAIADTPLSGVPVRSFPCVVADSIPADPRRVTLVINGHYPIFVYPKGSRPSGDDFADADAANIGGY